MVDRVFPLIQLLVHFSDLVQELVDPLVSRPNELLQRIVLFLQFLVFSPQHFYLLLQRARVTFLVLQNLLTLFIPFLPILADLGFAVEEGFLPFSDCFLQLFFLCPHLLFEGVDGPRRVRIGFPLLLKLVLQILVAHL